MNPDRLVTINLDSALNFFVDEFMPIMSNNEFKIYIYLYRQTVGANNQMASISLSRIIQGTALTKNTVIKTLRVLADGGYIYKVNRYTPCKYMLNYSTIFAGDASKFAPDYFILTEKYAKNTKIETGFPIAE